MIQDGKIVQKTWFGRVDKYEIINSFPNGYVVWNIGRHNFPYKGYIPLARFTDIPYNVDSNRLKTIKVGEPLASHIIKEAELYEINSLNYEDVVRNLITRNNYDSKRNSQFGCQDGSQRENA